MSHRKKAVVDGANVAFVEQTRDDQPKVSNLVAVCKALEEWDFEPVIVIDASLYHMVDDPQQLEGLLDQQTMQQAPAGTDADYFVLEIADDLDAIVVSNDSFDGYRDEFPWIEDRRVPLMIGEGEVQLYEPKLKEQS